MTNIYSDFNLKRIFEVIVSSQTIKGAQNNFFRTEIQEEAIAKYSGGHFAYVHEIGYDFEDINKTRYESKGLDTVWKKDGTQRAGGIIIKNTMPSDKIGKDTKEQTFDYILIWETGKRLSLYVATWEQCKDNIVRNSSGFTLKGLNKSDLLCVVDDYGRSSLTITDMNSKFEQFIKSLI